MLKVARGKEKVHGVQGERGEQIKYTWLKCNLKKIKTVPTKILIKNLFVVRLFPND